MENPDPDSNNNNVNLKSYDCLETIGSGGQAVVCKAKNEKGQIFAMKIRKVDRLPQSIYLREVRAGKRLRSGPGVVKFYDSFEEIEENGDRYLYMVFEYFEGQDLLRFMEDNNFAPMSEEDVKWIFTQLVKAIKYCHGKGVVHLDLKPENIMINSRLEIKLIDFGLCALDNSARICNERACTQMYAPPEVKTADHYDGELADVWGLGHVLFMLLIGELPFDIEVKRKYKHGMMEHPIFHWSLENGKKVSTQCRNLINQMLVNNPKRRINLADIEKHPWMKQTPPF